MLGSVPDDDVVVIADLEAGIGTMTRLDDATIDLVVVVVEPTPRSIDVAQRASAVAEAQGGVVVVGNKVADAADEALIAAAFPDAMFVPRDDAVDAADREGRSPLETGGTAVDALRSLADRIAGAHARATS